MMPLELYIRATILLLLIGIGIKSPLETKLVLCLFIGTLLLLSIMRSILEDIQDDIRIKKIIREQEENTKIYKKEILDYFNEGYLITDKFKGFKLTEKSIKEFLDVDFIGRIQVLESNSLLQIKTYTIEYKWQDVEDFEKSKYKIKRKFQVVNIKNGKKLY